MSWRLFYVSCTCLWRLKWNREWISAAFSSAACDCCLSAALCLSVLQIGADSALIVLMSNFLSKLHLLAAGIFMAAFVSPSNESIYLSLFAASSRFAVEINQHRDRWRKIVSIYPLARQLKCFVSAPQKAAFLFERHTACRLINCWKERTLTSKRSDMNLLGPGKHNI